MPVSPPDGTNREDTGDFAPDPRNVRLLKIAIYIMTTLLVIGVIVVAVTIVRRAGKLTATRTGFAPVEVTVPGEATIERLSLDGDRLAVHVKGRGGDDQILVLDVRRGAVVGRFKLRRQP